MKIYSGLFGVVFCIALWVVGIHYGLKVWELLLTVLKVA